MVLSFYYSRGQDTVRYYITAQVYKKGQNYFFRGGISGNMTELLKKTADRFCVLAEPVIDMHKA